MIDILKRVKLGVWITLAVLLGGAIIATLLTTLPSPSKHVATAPTPATVPPSGDNPYNYIPTGTAPAPDTSTTTTPSAPTTTIPSGPLTAKQVATQFATFIYSYNWQTPEATWLPQASKLATGQAISQLKLLWDLPGGQQLLATRTVQQVQQISLSKDATPPPSTTTTTVPPTTVPPSTTTTVPPTTTTTIPTVIVPNTVAPLVIPVHRGTPPATTPPTTVHHAAPPTTTAPTTTTTTVPPVGAEFTATLTELNTTLNSSFTLNITVVEDLIQSGHTWLVSSWSQTSSY